MGGMVVACKNGISPSIFGVWNGMAVACKNGISPSILAYGWHGDSDALIGPSILRMGGMVVACKKIVDSHFDLLKANAIVSTIMTERNCYN
jgi:hypothetical protein